MSYSFSAKGTTKQDAITAAKVEMDKVVEQQPIHAKDAPVVAETVKSVVGLLQDDTSNDVLVSVSGYVSWKYDDPSQPLTQAAVNVSAFLQPTAAA